MNHIKQTMETLEWKLSQRCIRGELREVMVIRLPNGRERIKLVEDRRQIPGDSNSWKRTKRKLRGEYREVLFKRLPNGQERLRVFHDRRYKQAPKSQYTIKQNKHGQTVIVGPSVKKQQPKKYTIS